MASLSSTLQVFSEHHKRIGWLRGDKSLISTDGDNLNDIITRLHDLSGNPYVRELREFANLVLSNEQEIITSDGQTFLALTFPFGWHIADKILYVTPKSWQTSNLVTADGMEILTADGKLIEVTPKPQPEPEIEDWQKPVFDDFYGGVPNENWRELLP